MICTDAWLSLQAPDGFSCLPLFPLGDQQPACDGQSVSQEQVRVQGWVGTQSSDQRGLRGRVWECGCRMRVRGLQLPQVQEGISGSLSYTEHSSRETRMHTHLPTQQPWHWLASLGCKEQIPLLEGRRGAYKRRGWKARFGKGSAAPGKNVLSHSVSDTMLIDQVPGRNQGRTGHLHLKVPQISPELIFNLFFSHPNTCEKVFARHNRVKEQGRPRL